jgi:hypothetical protein
MNSNKIIFVIVAFMLFTVACNKVERFDFDKNKEVEELKDYKFVEKLQKVERGEISFKKATEEVMQKARSIGCNSVASKYIISWIDKISSLNISALEYKSQRLIINEVCVVCILRGELIDTASWMENSPNLAFVEKARVLRWVKNQIDRLSPTRKINFKLLNEYEQCEYLDWRNCFITAISNYEQCIRKIERIEFPAVCEIISIEEQNRIKQNVEQILNRKFCAKDIECNESLLESPKMKAVLRYEMAR